MPLKTGEEGRFEIALSSKLIKDSSFEDVKEVLRKVILKIGLRERNFPNDIEKLVLFEHIVQNYWGNRLDEISLAFDMAISWKLGLEDVNCYENFSCAYFSMIMNAYQKWASQTFNQIKPPTMPVQRIFTKEELDDSAREDAERQYQMFLRGIELKNVSVNKAILFKDGLINLTETVMEFFERMVKLERQNIYKRQ